MWKICRKTIFPRWHTKRRSPGNKSSNCKDLKIVKFSPAQDEHSNSYGNRNSKQHAREQHSRFWDDPQFQYCSLRSNILETVGFVGTAVALCLDIQHRHCKKTFDYEGYRNSCLFSKFAFAMPNGMKKDVLRNGTTVSDAGEQMLSNLTCKSSSRIDQEEKGIDNLLEEMKDLTVDYVSTMENSAGMEFLKNDKKQAFHFFKASAQLGCPRGLYNLALSYEIGSGVNINLKKAALYYEKAASKGHVIATYNLGIFYMQGLGELPKDINKGMKLIKKAAKCGFSKAQLLLGVKYLDQEKWDQAYTMFKEAANHNCTESKYYLGLCYQNGWGVSKNETIAAEMYLEAASKGHEEAILSLGNFYEKGQGSIQRDIDFAMVLYKLIADKGHKGGEEALSDLRNTLDLTLKNTNSKSSDVSKTGERMKPKQSSLHPPVPLLRNSNSLPDYSKLQNLCKYLECINPVIPLRRSCKLMDNSFNIGSEDVKPTFGGTLDLRHVQHTIPHIVAAGS